LQLDVDVNAGNGAFIYLESNLGDLTEKVIHARVLLESGSGVSAKVYAQTGPETTNSSSGFARPARGFMGRRRRSGTPDHRPRVRRGSSLGYDEIDAGGGGSFETGFVEPQLEVFHSFETTRVC
jgi:hypothetical protein